MDSGEILTGKPEVIKFSFNIGEKLEQVGLPGKADVIQKATKVVKIVGGSRKEKNRKAKAEEDARRRAAGTKDIDLSHLYIADAGWFDDTIRQAVQTPSDICREMVATLNSADVKGKVVLTYNVEFLPRLLEAGELWFFADNQAKINYVEAAYPMVHIVKGRFLEWDTRMKFDVVVMNPPYEKSDGGHGRSSGPIYHRFIEKAIDEIQPDYLVSINPSRWMLGGKGLDKFRQRIMADKRMKVVVDDMTCDGIFPDVDIAGGVDYFLWDRRHDGKCSFNGVERALDEEDIVIRENESRSILRKVKDIANKWISEGASPRKPYGLEGDAPSLKVGVPCWFKQSIGLSFADPTTVKNPRNDLHFWRVLVPRSGGADITDNLGKAMKFIALRRAIIAKPGQYCTESYIVLKTFGTEPEAANFKTYLLTRFFRFMLRMRTVSQDITRDNYAWVPDLGDYTKPWTDVELYKMFGLTRQERDYIEGKIKPL